jgi:hypothetical protein
VSPHFPEGAEATVRLISSCPTTSYRPFDCAVVEIRDIHDELTTEFRSRHLGSYFVRPSSPVPHLRVWSIFDRLI